VCDLVRGIAIAGGELVADVGIMQASCFVVAKNTSAPASNLATLSAACFRMQVRGEQYAPRDTVTAIEPGRLREANMRLVEEFGSQVGWAEFSAVRQQW